MRDYILFYLNGERLELRGSLVFDSLSNFLRRERSLTGTKVVCAEGDCGACTVALGKFDGQQMQYRSVNSCIARMFQLDGASIVTVEGLHEEGKPSHVAQVFAENHGAQCGFCTPGFVCSMSLMFETKTSPTEQDVKNACTGNLCRCTGYRSIIDAGMKIEPIQVTRISQRYSDKTMLDDFQKHKGIEASIVADSREYYRPNTFASALDYLAKKPKARIYGTGTDLGVLINKHVLSLESVLDIQHISEAKQVSQSDDHIVIGASVSLDDLEKTLEASHDELSRFYRVFASPQIKHLATLAGNIANASPIGDSMPPLMVLGAEVCIGSSKKESWLPLDDFYLSYRKTKLQQGELIKKVRIPKRAPENFKVYKIAKRKDLDISTVSAAFDMEVHDGKIKDLKVALGGVADKPIRLKNVEDKSKGRPFNGASIDDIKTWIQQEIQPLDDHRGSAWYRKILAGNLFDKYVADIASIGGSGNESN